MLMHALEVLCNEPECCIFCWQVDMQFSYATHLAHPVLCRPTHLNIYGYEWYKLFWEKGKKTTGSGWTPAGNCDKLLDTGRARA